MPATHAERVTARRERLEVRAAKARAEANRVGAESHRMLDAIPFGQPMLVGHHSYKRDVNYRARAWRKMGRSVELSKEADRLASLAGSSTGISSDDSDAVELLTVQAAQIRAKIERMKAANKAVRKHAGAGRGAQFAALIALGLSETLANKVLTPDFAGRVGFPSYSITNAGANARRIEARIVELGARQEAAVEAGGSNAAGWVWGEDREANRVWITFPERQDRAVVARLRSAGFIWARSSSRWQRKTSNAAIHHAKAIIEAGAA